MLKWRYCRSDFPQKLLRATKPLVPLRLKNLAASHLVLRGKASQMICDHRNFTLGQLEAACWPAMSRDRAAPLWPCLVQQGLLRGQKCRRTGSDLLCLFQKYVLHVRKKATETAETSFMQIWETG